MKWTPSIEQEIKQMMNAKLQYNHNNRKTSKLKTNKQKEKQETLNTKQKWRSS